MSLTEFTYKLLLIFLPGIISFIIVDNLTVHKKTKVHHWIFYSFIFGLISYFPWYIIINMVKIIYSIDIPFRFITNLVNPNERINFGEIIIATCVSIINGYFFAFLYCRKIPFHISKWLKISDKFPEVDTWDLVSNKHLPCWVYIRDYENNKIYRGYLMVTSDCTQRDGLYMGEVTVYDLKGDELYKVKSMFLPRKMEQLVIEFLD